MEENPIVVKSFAFAVRIAKLSRYLPDRHREFTLSRELLSSGTNVGKHVKSAVTGDGTENFISSMLRAMQKADETEYWLQLLHFASYLTDDEFQSIETDRKEVARMLNSIVNTSKKNA
jgi:four helix bundle protein